MEKDDKVALIAMTIIMIPMIAVGVAIVVDAALGHC